MSINGCDSYIDALMGIVSPVDILDASALLPSAEATSAASIDAMAPPIGLPRTSSNERSMTETPNTPPAGTKAEWEWERTRHAPALEVLDERMHRAAFIGTDDTNPDGSDQSVTSGEVIGWSHKQERDALATFCAVMGTPATIEPGYVSVDFNALADAILAAGYHR